MGQAESGIQGGNQAQKAFLSKYNYVKTEKTESLGEFNLYEEKNNDNYSDYVMVKEIRCDSKNEYDALKQKVEIRKRLKSPYLVKFIASYSDVETEWCSKYYRHFVVYDYSSLTFEKELYDRFKIGQRGPAPKVNLNLKFFFQKKFHFKNFHENFLNYKFQINKLFLIKKKLVFLRS